ncbi:transglutaminase domain-containing protein [Agromyces seonyuensis]|uniref:Transglutaminase domain-containing protein n=1 Tax=Agromyces seonyuensis TaxID=2662446 RepID=A0A6I4NZX8_9MICO|nr:transglutaminase-like domain-containing protein [Agromyces seonyuensis]MWB98772.1 hypothetical protein [Agromyces seonyuensis]
MMRRDAVSIVFSAIGLAVLHLAGSLPWWSTYETGRFALAGVLAVGAGIVIGFLGARGSWSFRRLVLVTVGAFLVLGVPAAVPSKAAFGFLPTPAGLVDLVVGVAASWRRLVSVPDPVGSFEALLVPYFLLALVSAVVATGLALRTSRPGTAVLPPLVLFVAGIAFGSERDDAVVLAAFLAVAAGASWLAGVEATRRRRLRIEPVLGAPEESARAARSGAAGRVRRLVGAVAMVAAAALVAGGAAALPTGNRSVIRSVVQPPFDPTSESSPLAAYRASFAEDVRDEPVLEVSGLPEGVPLRLAALDRYDGVVYTIGGDSGAGGGRRFVRVPYRLDQSDSAGDQVALDVRVLDYSGTWLPSAGDLERVEFTGSRADELASEVFVQAATGTVAVGSGLQPGDGYRLDAVLVPPRDPATLVPGDSTSGPTAEVPSSLRRLLLDWAPAGAALSQGEQLAAAIDGLRTGYLSHGGDDEEPSRSGHAIDRIDELASVVPMLGDAEQYAVAAALLAHEIGFPVRVVVGYRGGVAAGGATLFHERDRSAWIEVQDVSGDWFALDPVPEERPVPPREPDDPMIIAHPDSVLPPPDPGTPVEEVDDDTDAGTDQPRPDSPDWFALVGPILLAVLLVLLAAALAAAPFAAVVLAKERRRRLRRTAGDTPSRIEGAWDETVDAALDYGARVTPGATRAEQAEEIGGIAPMVLAAVVDRQLFGPEAPTDAAALEVWDLADRLRERMGNGLSRRERFAATVSLVTFGGESQRAESPSSTAEPADAGAGARD